MANPACTSTRTSPLWIGSGNGSAGSKPRPNLPSTRQAPHVTERDAPVHQFGDVDAAVAQRAAVLVGFRDLGGEGHDAFESLDEVDGQYRRASHVPNSRTPTRARSVRAVTPEEHLARMRVEYGSVEKDGSSDLDGDWLDDGWIALLRKWLTDAERTGISEPNAMVVGTVDARGWPVTRTVLCKSVDESGISFYTNYDSDKGEQLAAQPHASVTFPWYALGRQVHVRGAVTKVSPEATANYWNNRPRGSQLGAWASHQSKPIASRAELMQQLADVTERFADLEAVPVPPNWGGYLVAPDVVEFWQGRENRMHNRIRVAEGHVERLQP